MLREAVAAGTEVGKKAQDLMKAGALVGDDVVIGIIADRIKEPDCKTGFKEPRLYWLRPASNEAVSGHGGTDACHSRHGRHAHEFPERTSLGRKYVSKMNKNQRISKNIEGF